MSLLYHNDTIIKKEKELLRALLGQFCKLEFALPHSSSFLLFLLIFELNNKIPEHKNNTQIIIFSWFIALYIKHIMLNIICTIEQITPIFCVFLSIIVSSINLNLSNCFTKSNLSFQHKLFKVSFMIILNWCLFIFFQNNII